MRTIVFASAVALLVIASTADASNLVVLGTNSGSDITSPYAVNQEPNMPTGMKGFLIGIEVGDAVQNAPLSVQNMAFTGVVHQQGQKDDLGDPLATPLNLKTRSVATLQQVYDTPPANGYLRSDTYVMDNAQQGSFVWTPVGPGFEGGAVGDTFFRVTGSLGLPSQIDGPGQVQFVYVVSDGTHNPGIAGLTLGDVPISGLIARGATGFDALGMPVQTPGQIYLDYETGTILRVPEPSTIVLAGLGMLGLVVAARKRRK